MAADQKKIAELHAELDETIAQGLKHLVGAEHNLISGNADLIMDIVFQSMLADKITFEQASVEFVLKALRFQKSRDFFEIGDRVQSEGDPHQPEAA
jgi:hypothetical protein